MNDANRTRQLAPRLLAWYDRAKRDLPWRRTHSPYRIWLAETMLQQTRVEQAIPYYRRFLRRFPSLAALARAPVDDVLALWAGLGYYARARSFHAAAREVVKLHKGRVPRDRAAFLALPGVGPYTAGAVLSIAFGRAEPIVDGNVIRVLCRAFGLSGNPKAGRTRARLWELAAELIPKDRPGDFNQAMMELGATVCTPKGPDCARCPASDLCEAFEQGKQAQWPNLPKAKPTPHVDVAVGLVWRRGKLLIAKRPMDKMLGGLWEFPGGKPRKNEPLETAVRREVREETALDVEVGERLASVNHAYSHFRVTLHAFHCRSTKGRARPLECDACKWVAPDELDQYPFPAGSLRIIRKLREE